MENLHRRKVFTIPHVVVVIFLLTFFFSGYLARNLTPGKSAARTASERYGLLQAKARANPKRGEVPFTKLKRGNCGKAVFQMEAALRRVHARKRPAQQCFGWRARADVQRFQRRIHYKPTGVYNYATHLALVKRKGYTHEARRVLIYEARVRYNVTVRTAVKRVALHLYKVGGNSQGYTQGGGRSNFPAWPAIPDSTDCSGEVTWIAYQSGFGAALGYYGPGSSVGWTGTLLAQGQIVSPSARLAIGDLIFYPGHVAMYIGKGQEISHGGSGVDIRPIGNYDQARRYFR